jgi:hypothetical protein
MMVTHAKGIPKRDGFSSKPINGLNPKISWWRPSDLHSALHETFKQLDLARFAPCCHSPDQT